MTAEDSPGVTSSNTGNNTTSGVVGGASDGGTEAILDLGGRGGEGGGEGEGEGGSEDAHVEQGLSEEVRFVPNVNVVVNVMCSHDCHMISVPL